MNQFKKKQIKSESYIKEKDIEDSLENYRYENRENNKIQPIKRKRD